MAMITLSNAAKEYIESMIIKEQGVAFRISVKRTGCSGYAYSPSIVNQINDHDNVVHANNLNIYLDTAWIDLLDGVDIDYIEENSSGLKQKRLVFNNKKESGRCGCGESFHLENSKDV